jgi:light-regulated signal transduction histidine kinase (bacteriophytochrome)
MAIKRAAVDLAICDREPIHTPGSIQPHGIMLVVTRMVFWSGRSPVKLSNAWA